MPAAITDLRSDRRITRATLAALRNAEDSPPNETSGSISSDGSSSTWQSFEDHEVPFSEDSFMVFLSSVIVMVCQKYSRGDRETQALPVLMQPAVAMTDNGENLSCKHKAVNEVHIRPRSLNTTTCMWRIIHTICTCVSKMSMFLFECLAFIGFMLIKIAAFFFSLANSKLGIGTFLTFLLHIANNCQYYSDRLNDARQCYENTDKKSAGEYTTLKCSWYSVTFDVIKLNGGNLYWLFCLPFHFIVSLLTFKYGVVTTIVVVAMICSITCALCKEYKGLAVSLAQETQRKK